MTTDNVTLVLLIAGTLISIGKWIVFGWDKSDDILVLFVVGVLISLVSAIAVYPTSKSIKIAENQKVLEVIDGKYGMMKCRGYAIAEDYSYSCENEKQVCNIIKYHDDVKTVCVDNK